MLCTRTKRITELLCQAFELLAESEGIVTNEYYGVIPEVGFPSTSMHSASQARLPDALAMVKAWHMTSSHRSHVVFELDGWLFGERRAMSPVCLVHVHKQSHSKWKQSMFGMQHMFQTRSLTSGSRCEWSKTTFTLLESPGYDEYVCVLEIV